MVDVTKGLTLFYLFFHFFFETWGILFILNWFIVNSLWQGNFSVFNYLFGRSSWPCTRNHLWEYIVVWLQGGPVSFCVDLSFSFVTFLSSSIAFWTRQILIQKFFRIIPFSGVRTGGAEYLLVKYYTIP